MTYFKTYRKWTTAKKCEYNGRKYDSKFEASYGMELELLKKAGEIIGFNTHERIPLEVNGKKVCDYYIDFVVDHKDGTTEYVETKGYETPVWKLKWKLFCALYEDKPNIKITLIKQGA